MEALPVFPLDMVVFPGQSVPLYVFEARYRRLVQEAVAMEEPSFIVVRRLADTEEPLFGTVVRVVELAERPDGTYTLTAHGGDRVAVQVARREDVAESDGSERPLFFANPEPAPLERDDLNTERVAAWDALEAFRTYARTFFGGASAELDEHIPDDPLYQASFICANLRIESAERQRLLDARSLAERFRLAEQVMAERVTAHRPSPLEGR
jgi:Lon protease-like protein